MNILKFHQFCEEKFKLSHFLSLVYDGRKNPLIPTSIIFKAVFFMAVLGVGSLLALDQFLRAIRAKRLFKSSGPVVSDTTMARSLEGYDLPLLHKILYSVYSIARRRGKSRCELENDKIRIGVIDGSEFKKFAASCFAEIG